MELGFYNVVLDIVTKFIVPIAPLIIFALIVFWFNIRSGTSFGVLNRFYRFLSGGVDFNNSRILEFWKQCADVERFNVVFGVRAKSISEVEKFEKWIRNNEINVSFVSNLGNRFNIEHRKVQKTKTYEFVLPILAASLIYLFSIPVATVARVDVALISLKGDSKWFWTDGDVAQSIRLPFVNQWRIDSGVCELKTSDQISEITGFSTEFSKVICDSLGTQETKDYVATTIGQQKSFWWIVVLLGLIVCFCIWLLIRVAKAHAARTHVYRQIKRRRVGSNGKFLQEPCNNELSTESSRA